VLPGDSPLAGLRPIPTRRVMIGFRCQRRLTQGPAVNWPTAATRYADTCDHDAKCVCAGQVRCCLRCGASTVQGTPSGTTRKPTLDSRLTVGPSKPSNPGPVVDRTPSRSGSLPEASGFGWGLGICASSRRVIMYCRVEIYDQIVRSLLNSASLSSSGRLVLLG